MAPLVAIVIALTWIPASLCGLTTSGDDPVLEGRTITIPCHYESKYTGNVKYWCQGSMKEFCTTVARTDTPGSGDDGRVTIFDDHAQQVFTVTMRDSTLGDTGWYWCGVELGTMWELDVLASRYINVIHGMSVVNNMIIGEEGSSATIECVYSRGFRESQKKWCRSGGWSTCLVTDSEGSYEDTSVAIRDDRDRAFTVTLKKLEMRDTGWYLCAAAQQQMSIHVQVNPRPSTTSSLTTSPPMQNEQMPMNSTKAQMLLKNSQETPRRILDSVFLCSGLMFVVLTVCMAIKKIIKAYSKSARPFYRPSVKMSNIMEIDIQDMKTPLIPCHGLEETKTTPQNIFVDVGHI